MSVVQIHSGAQENGAVTQYGKSACFARRKPKVQFLPAPQGGNKMTISRWKRWRKRWIHIFNDIQPNKIITYIDGVERFVQIN